MSREIIKPEPGVPVLVTLDSDEPKEVEGNFGPQWQYIVNDDEGIMWLPDAAKRAIDRSGAKRGNTISLTREKNGQRNTWTATLAKQEPARSQAAARPRPTRETTTPDEPREQSTPTQSFPLAEKLQTFLRAAAQACQQIEKEAQQNGYRIEFQTRDISALASTLFISHSKEGR